MMSRLGLVLAILVATLAACASTSTVPATKPSQPAATPAAPASARPASVSPSPASPSDAPPPATQTPVVTPAPTPPVAVKPTVEEEYLLAGVRSDLTNCIPFRDGLPPRTTGAIQCETSDPAAARVGFFLFDGTVDLLAAYRARMDAEGVKKDSVACTNTEGEAAYIPGDGEIESRHGCFVNDEGYANYRATVPGYLLYIGVLGRSGDMRSLNDFAWRGNRDVPGMPTLWIEPAD
jgi:hypothetical protein